MRDYFSDIPALIKIAYCESRFTHYLKDGTVLKGRITPADEGALQINKDYHGTRMERLGLDAENLMDNLKFGRILYNEQGTQPWDASQGCWGGLAVIESH